MRILIDIRLLSKGGQSGIEEYTRLLVSHLLSFNALQTNSGNEYLLFYNGFRKKPLADVIPNMSTGQVGLRWNDEGGGIQVIDWQWPNKLLDFSSRFLNWPKIDLLTGANIVLSPHINILRCARAKRIMTIHDLSFIHHPYFFPRKHRLWHWLQSYKNQARQADLIVAISEFTKRDIVETLRVPAEKVKVVYPGINPIFNKIRKCDALNLKIQKPYILYLGTVEPRKNVEAIIKAFQILKSGSNFDSLKLVIAGKLGWLYQNVIDVYHQSPCKKDIIFLGPIESNDRIKLYDGAEALIFPSFFEGFGLPPLEAQARGCPVIASNRSSLPEVLQDSAKLIDPWKTGELADTIKAVLTDHTLKEQLTLAGLKNVQRFNWQKTAQEILNLL